MKRHRFIVKIASKILQTLRLDSGHIVITSASCLRPPVFFILVLEVANHQAFDLIGSAVDRGPLIVKSHDHRCVKHRHRLDYLKR